MATPYRIIDLTQSSTPTGNELAEISNGGNGSLQIPIAVLASARQPSNVTVGGSTVTVSSTGYGDILVNVSSGGTTVNLPAASTRSGVPVAVVDVGGTASTSNIVINANGAEKIKGSSSLTISTNFQGVNLWPLSTGGWYTK